MVAVSAVAAEAQSTGPGAPTTTSPAQSAKAEKAGEHKPDKDITDGAVPYYDPMYDSWPQLPTMKGGRGTDDNGGGSDDPWAPSPDPDCGGGVPIWRRPRDILPGVDCVPIDTRIIMSGGADDANGGGSDDPWAEVPSAPSKTSADQLNQEIRPPSQQGKKAFRLNLDRELQRISDLMKGGLH